MPRYYIEQAPDRYYSKGELPSAKARARRLSKSADSGVYILAEQFDRERGDWFIDGSIAFFGGVQDGREGSMA